MQTTHFTSGEPAVVITRVAQRQWHALEDDRVAGRGGASARPDGRIFVSIDAWHRSVFDQLADAMLAELPAPLHTIVDETDVELTAGWERAGFTTRRREWEYVVPTGGAGRVLPPPGVTIVPRGSASEGASAISITSMVNLRRPASHLCSRTIAARCVRSRTSI